VWSCRHPECTAQINSVCCLEVKAALSFELVKGGHYIEYSLGLTLLVEAISVFFQGHCFRWKLRHHQLHSSFGAFITAIALQGITATVSMA
jgi:hypothetical protein